MPTLILTLDKGWMPDMPPFDVPEGGLTDTEQVLPSVLGYRGLDVAEGGATGVKSRNVVNGIEFKDRPECFFGTGDRLYLTTGGPATDVTRLSSNKYNAGVAGAVG